MKTPAAFLPIALALAAIILSPMARAQDAREEGPREIKKCQTISKSGSYKLVNNLTFMGPANTACLTITSDNVTIDLAGFSISLAGVLNGSGISATPSSGSTLVGITVRNGSISGPGGISVTGGVDLGSAFASIVEGLHVNRMGFFGIIATGIVRGNSVFDIVDGPGEGVGISATGIITGNYVNGYRRVGMEIGQGSTVIGNTVVNGIVQARGIVVGCPSNVTDNTAVNNPGSNLVLNGNGCNNTNNVAP